MTVWAFLVMPSARLKDTTSTTSMRSRQRVGRILYREMIQSLDQALPQRHQAPQQRHQALPQRHQASPQRPRMQLGSIPRPFRLSERAG
jgi:hypothetical protein